MKFTSEEELLSIFLKNPTVCTDSRKPIAGSIFFALSGPSFNGNRFAADALAQGCLYAVVDDSNVCADSRYLYVSDVLLALQNLARNKRRMLKATIIGITGSNGKTTSKELVRNVLSAHFKTYATSGNLNNHIGVPLTLLQIPDDTEFAIVEMGASKQGDIKELCEIAEPNFGLITNIGKAHLEGMGGLDGVLKTKTELYQFIKQSKGKIFLNLNHKSLVQSAAIIESITYGNDSNAMFQGEMLNEHPFVSLKWRNSLTNVNGEINSKLPGYYNFENLLAAACIGNYFHVPQGKIDEALSRYQAQNHRSQIIRAGTNKIFMDAYNANPTSMEASLRSFAQEEGTAKLVILGKMMELGSYSEDEHRAITQLALSFPNNKVVLIGNEYPEHEGVEHRFEQTDDAVKYFEAHPVKNHTILLKGSRANSLERLLKVFEAA